jgi:hypothetical protein
MNENDLRIKIAELDSEAVAAHTRYRKSFLSMGDILFGTSAKHYAEYKRLSTLRDNYITILNSL